MGGDKEFRFKCSMATIKKEIDTIDNYFTAILYGPIEITPISSSDNYQNMNTNTYQLNIYKGNSYTKLDNNDYQTDFTHYILEGSQNQTNKIFDIMPLSRPGGACGMGERT